MQYCCLCFRATFCALLATAVSQHSLVRVFRDRPGYLGRSRVRGDRSNKGAESGCKARAAGNAANVILRLAAAVPWWVILEKATSLSIAFAGKILTG